MEVLGWIAFGTGMAAIIVVIGLVVGAMLKDGWERE
jgi:hypothetical protein